MPIITDLLVEMGEIIEAARNANDRGCNLELSYLMGKIGGNSILIHELTKKKEDEFIENPKSA